MQRFEIESIHIRFTMPKMGLGKNCGQDDGVICASATS